MTENKPAAREFWIEFSGDPRNDTRFTKRKMSGEPFEPMDFGDEIIHVIEYSAYDKLKNDYERLVRDYGDEVSGLCDNQRFKQLNKALERIAELENRFEDSEQERIWMENKAWREENAKLKELLSAARGWVITHAMQTYSKVAEDFAKEIDEALK